MKIYDFRRLYDTCSQKTVKFQVLGIINCNYGFEKSKTKKSPFKTVIDQNKSEKVGISRIRVKSTQILEHCKHNQAIGLMSRVFGNSPGDQGSIPGRVIPKTQKMVLDSALLNTQHYEVWIKGKVEQSREWSSALPYTLV